MLGTIADSGGQSSRSAGANVLTESRPILASYDLAPSSIFHHLDHVAALLSAYSDTSLSRCQAY